MMQRCVRQQYEVYCFCEMAVAAVSFGSVPYSTTLRKQVSGVHDVVYEYTQNTSARLEGSGLGNLPPYVNKSAEESCTYLLARLTNDRYAAIWQDGCSIDIAALLVEKLARQGHSYQGAAACV